MIRVLPLLLAIPLAAATYEDPAGKFHFDLPSGWTAKVQGRLPDETPITFARGEFSCDLTVLVEEGGGTLDEAANEVEADLVVQGDVGREEASVDRMPAVRLTLTPDDPALGLTVVLVAVCDPTRFVVELRADRDAWRRDRAQYDAVLGGFHIGDPEYARLPFLETDLAVKDDGTQLVAGNPPLTYREVSGCLGAVEFAYGIELTESEKERLLEALKESFLEGEEGARRSLVELSEEGWTAREAAAADLQPARTSIDAKIKAGTSGFERAAREVVGAATGEKPTPHDVGVVQEWVEFVFLLAVQSNTIAPTGTGQDWPCTDNAVTDVEWMALRAAYCLASDADRMAYRNRLLAAMGGTEENAALALGTATEGAPALVEKLREAAKPLLDTLSPPVDLTDPAKNGAIRYRY